MPIIMNTHLTFTPKIIKIIILLIFILLFFIIFNGNN